MAARTSAQYVHDSLWGNSDLHKRTYPEFLRDAEILGTPFDLRGIIKDEYQGAKLSWGPGRVPAWDVKGQCVVRSLKWMIGSTVGGYAADSLKASRNARDWAVVLSTNYKEQRMGSEDERIFTGAQRAFEHLRGLYQAELETADSAEKRRAVANYAEAARVMGQYAFQGKVQHQREFLVRAPGVLSAEELGQYLVLHARVLGATEWFPAVRPDLREPLRLLPAPPVAVVEEEDGGEEVVEARRDAPVVVAVPERRDTLEAVDAAEEVNPFGQ